MTCLCRCRAAWKSITHLLDDMVHRPNIFKNPWFKYILFWGLVDWCGRKAGRRGRWKGGEEEDRKLLSYDCLVLNRWVWHWGSQLIVKIPEFLLASCPWPSSQPHPPMTAWTKWPGNILVSLRILFHSPNFKNIMSFLEVWTSAFPVFCHMILNKLLNLSEPQFLM